MYYKVNYLLLNVSGNVLENENQNSAITNTKKVHEASAHSRILWPGILVKIVTLTPLYEIINDIFKNDIN